MMTRVHLIVSLVVGLMLVGGDIHGAKRIWGQWENSLKPKDKPANEIALAVGGQTEYVIVIPAAPTTQEQKAAEELAQWLGEMTGATFPVVSDTEPAIPAEISVGRTNRLAAANLAVTKQDLGDEGYAIAAKGDRLFLIGGKKRGPIYAVFALLEEDLGCRWYTQKWEGEMANRIPRRPTVRVRVVPRSYVPALEIRDAYYRDAFIGPWSLRNRTNSNRARVPEEWGGHMDYALFVHTFNTLVPPGEYFDGHPEYFMLTECGQRSARQLCLTNPETLRITIESVLRILKDRPNSEIISVSANDGGGTACAPTVGQLTRPMVARPAR